MRSFHCLIRAVVTGACILGFFSGCAKAPDQELGAAKAAIKAAQDAQADQYMPNNFVITQKALETAEQEIERQSKVFILSRKYKRAKQLLKNATDLATQIAADVPKAKEDLNAQVKDGLTSAQNMAKETRVYLNKAPQVKSKDVLVQMKADLDVADSALVQAASLVAAENVLEARQKLSTAQDLLKKIFDQFPPPGSTEGSR